MNEDLQDGGFAGRATDFWEGLVVSVQSAREATQDDFTLAAPSGGAA